jgi:hypothetical protein
MLLCDAATLVADVSKERVDFVFKVSKLIINAVVERNKTGKWMKLATASYKPVRFDP